MCSRIGNQVGAIVIKEASSPDIKMAKIFKFILRSGIKFFEFGIREQKIPDLTRILGREIPSRPTPTLTSHIYTDIQKILYILQNDVKDHRKISFNCKQHRTQYMQPCKPSNTKKSCYYFGFTVLKPKNYENQFFSHLSLQVSWLQDNLKEGWATRVSQSFFEKFYLNF